MNDVSTVTLIGLSALETQETPLMRISLKINAQY